MTPFCRDTLDKHANLPVTMVNTRRIKIADKDTTTVDGFVTFEGKLGDFPTETLQAYAFPLKGIDVVIGLPWLRKYNPHVDWRMNSWELTRNGRRYQLYPAKPKQPPKFDIMAPEEFNAFVEQDE